MDIKISVIIPVYNKEQYLHNAIESIISSDIDELEIIAVDDGSTDDSLKLLNEISLKNEKLKVFTKPNGGSSSARNLGINKSTGKYIIFLDADDHLDKGAIKSLYIKAEKEQADVVVFDIIKEYPNYSEIWRDFSSDDSKVHQGKNYVDNFMTGMCIPSACNKLWKRSLFIDNDIYFPEDIDYGEDGATVPRLMINAKRIVKINAGMYHYTIHAQSKIFDTNSNIYEYVESYNLVLDYFKEKKIIYDDSIKFNYKYTYAYKIIEGVSIFDNKIKNDSYKRMYREFLEDIKKENSCLVFSEDPLFDKKHYKMSKLIISAYKTNRIFGEAIKILFIIAKKIKNWSR